jgi:hypothetical protein
MLVILPALVILSASEGSRSRPDTPETGIFRCAQDDDRARDEFPFAFCLARHPVAP